MNLYCETERLVMQVLPAYYNHQVLQFFMENKEHLEPWEAQRDKNFYTANYQRALLEVEYNQMVHKKMLRYYLFLKENPDCIVGSVCANNIRYGAFENCSIGYKIHKQYCKQGYGIDDESSRIYERWYNKSVFPNSIISHNRSSFWNWLICCNPPYRIKIKLYPK